MLCTVLEKDEIVTGRRAQVRPIYLKGPKHEKKFVVGIFTQLRSVCIGELETWPKTYKINGWGLIFLFWPTEAMDGPKNPKTEPQDKLRSS